MSEMKLANEEKKAPAALAGFLFDLVVQTWANFSLKKNGEIKW